MSELTLRDFPPVEPLQLEHRGRRYSMTLLRHANRCMRSAYLYLKYAGGPAGHHLNRGTVAHIAFERILRHMVEHGAPWFDERGREHTAGEIPMDVAKDIMAEAIATFPGTVPAEEQARLRVMAAHFAEGFSVDPARIVGIEQKVMLSIEEFTIVGKLDLVLKADESLEVIDWKTAYAMSKMEDLAEKLRDGRLAPKSFQLLVYILLAAFGIPVETVVCDGCGGVSAPVPAPDEVPEDGIPWNACARCEGRGYIDVPTRDEPLGAGVNVFSASELYPQYLYDDGLGLRGPLHVTRPELIDHMAMLEGLVFKVAAALGEIEVPGLEPWKFEALSGTHCNECPAKADCPLPAHLRSWAGEINDMEQAREAAVKLDVDKAQHAARQKELRIFAGLHGPIRVGADEVWDFSEESSRSTDWPALEGAIQDAAEYGKPFNLDDHRKVSTSNRFKKRKLSPEEIADYDSPRDEPVSLTDRFGDDAPF